MDGADRLDSGIDGLDDLLNGGIPKNHSVFVAGPAGSGKTSFALEFLFKGARDHDHNGLYISFEETEDQLLHDLPFSWDLSSMIDRGKINIVKYDPYQYEDIIDLVRSSVKENKAQRVVIDSLTALSLYIDDTKDVRKLILDLNEQLRKLDCTSIYVGEIETGNEDAVSRYGVEEFIADGVIILRLKEEGSELKNQIRIRKMRGTDHDKSSHPFTYQTEGLKVYAREEAFDSAGGPSRRAASEEF